MPTQKLVTTLTVTNLNAGATTFIPHGLKANGKGLTPTQVICDRNSTIGVTGYDSLGVTFTNIGPVMASAIFRVEYDHSIHAVDTPTVAWKGWDGAALVSSNPAIYGAFTSSVDQVIGVTPSVVQFDTVEAASGVTLVSGSRLTVATSGVYGCDISPQLYHTGGGTETITFWLRVNGVDVPRSASSLEMGNNNNRTLPFLQIDLPLNAGQYIEWVFVSTTATNLTLENFPAVLSPPAAFAVPAIPSVIANVKRIGAL